MSGPRAIADRRAFILAETRLRPVPHAPEISLHVADEATELWRRTEEELGEMGLPPPFWAFAWAGGQALARYVLDHPELVRGRRVLDFASGSGLVAIAAARAGAASVEAAEIDDFAAEAIVLNAEANAVGDRISVSLGDLAGQDRGWETILARRHLLRAHRRGDGGGLAEAARGARRDGSDRRSGSNLPPARRSRGDRDLPGADDPGA